MIAFLASRRAAEYVGSRNTIDKMILRFKKPKKKWRFSRRSRKKKITRLPQ